uniref:PIH1 N-terminal domain-containing protein n=1 Tax=Graphocephala atropunctata TaxID=36148 RepID=A0A1B6M3W4_9HEMI
MINYCSTKDETVSKSMESVLSPLPGNRPVSRNTPRLFRSPPQPHMCVQDTLKGTPITCFINVMSWCKIGIPSQPNAPIPLYGGVRVPLSDRCSISPKQVKTTMEKPLVFAVMVNPNVLKQSGKMAQNPQERDSLIDLMLDFIEAMNENVKFSRNFTVLRDRDLTGELKDIWAVIQAKRDAEKNHCTSNLTLRDENSQPFTPQNAKHKRTDVEGECMESAEVCCQNEAASLQSEARGDS